MFDVHFPASQPPMAAHSSQAVTPSSPNKKYWCNNLSAMCRMQAFSAGPTVYAKLGEKAWVSAAVNFQTWGGAVSVPGALDPRISSATRRSSASATFFDQPFERMDTKGAV
jgi:hypothetical protein